MQTISPYAPNTGYLFRKRNVNYRPPAYPSSSSKFFRGRFVGLIYLFQQRSPGKDYLQLNVIIADHGDPIFAPMRYSVPVTRVPSCDRVPV